jgi:hypothetical protein
MEIENKNMEKRNDCNGMSKMDLYLKQTQI